MLKQILQEPVSKYTDHQLLVVEQHVTVKEAAKEMIENKTDSILVYEDDDVVGIVTSKDILSEVVAKGKNPNDVKVIEIAHKPIIRIHQDSSVKEAISMMNKYDIRRLVVKNDERTIGIISRKRIAGNLKEYAVDLPELESPQKYLCPYCRSVFRGKDILSIHIDDIHIGKGLLEGNIAKAKV